MTQEQSKLNECRTLIFCVPGFPCQVSLSPKQEGCRYQRNTVLRIPPGWLQTSDLRIHHNVPGLLSHDKEAGPFHTIPQ